jgi:hypothetical protein
MVKNMGFIENGLKEAFDGRRTSSMVASSAPFLEISACFEELEHPLRTGKL